jgi:predicted ATP-binding protein involved in virulence
VRLGKIEVQNYRIFEACTLALDPHLTVLVAENGQGKTALLDAIAMSLGPVVDVLSDTRQWQGISVDDVRLDPAALMAPQLPTWIKAEGALDGQRLHWEVWRASAQERTRTTTKLLQPLRDTAQALRARLDRFAGNPRDTAAPSLPVLAHYGTGRLWAEERLTQRRQRQAPSPLGRLAGYEGALSPSSSFKTFAAWYGQQMEALRAPGAAAIPTHERPERLLAAVNEAVRVVLAPAGWEALDWDLGARRLMVTHPAQGRLPLSWLSDGVRSMIALVADLAHRCVRLNPQWSDKAPQMTEGVVLVDEIDMHLHPGWQQVVMGLLQAAFPRVQWVVTTQSPQVLSTVKVSSVRVLRLRDGEVSVEQPRFQTRGAASANVMGVIMGIDPIPPVPEAAQVSRYRALIEDGLGESNEALALREALLEHFGEHHPVMLDCARLLRFQQLRLRRQPAGVRLANSLSKQ